MAETALITDKFRVYNAKQFLESFDEASSTNHFFFVGRSANWQSVIEFYDYNDVSNTDDVNVGDSISIQTLAGYPATTHATVTAVLNGAILVSGLDPAALTTLKFGLTFTWSGGTGGSAKILKIRPASEDEPLRPVDNLDEKFSYFREIIAAKRIYNTTLGEATGTSPDSSFVSPVVNRLDYGKNTDASFSDRIEPYDMWRSNYANTSNYKRLSQESGTWSGTASVSNLEMIVRTPDYNVWMCIDNKRQANGDGATPDLFSGPTRNTLSGGGGTNPEGTGYCTANGIYTTTNGYKWKWLYSLSIEQVLRFQSQKFIPVAPFTGVSVVGPEVVSILSGGTGYLSGGSGELFAPINGDGQVNDTNMKIAKLTITNGVITAARVLLSSETTGKTNTEYTFAKISLEPGAAVGVPDGQKFGLYTTAALTTAATTQVPTNVVNRGSVEVIIPPQGGYGSTGAVGSDGYGKFLEQLNAKRVMCNVRLTFAEGAGDFPVTNDFRRIGLIRDPNAFNGTNTGVAITNASSPNYDTVRQTYALAYAAAANYGSNFVVGETITQNLTLTGGITVQAKAIVVEWIPNNDTNSALGGILRYYQDPVLHSTNGKLYNFYSATVAPVTAVNPIIGSVTGQHGTIAPSFATGNTAYGVGNLGTLAIDSVQQKASDLYPELAPYTGEIIYVENRRLITRAIDQIEDIKLVIEF